MLVEVLCIASNKKPNPNWLKQKRRKGVFYGPATLKTPCWILPTGGAWFSHNVSGLFLPALLPLDKLRSLIPPGGF